MRANFSRRITRLFFGPNFLRPILIRSDNGKSLDTKKSRNEMSHSSLSSLSSPCDLCGLGDPGGPGGSGGPGGPSGLS